MKLIIARAGAMLLAAVSVLLMLGPASHAGPVQANNNTLTAAQSQSLQRQVDQYARLTNGHQVSRNEVQFSGGTVTIPVPGVAPAARGTLHGCRVGYFCIYHDTHYTGAMVSLYYCASSKDLELGWYGQGSWMNNQIGSNARATFYASDHRTILGYSLPPVHSSPSINWAPIYYISPC